MSAEQMPEQSTDPQPRPVTTSIVNNVVYVDGRPVGSPATVPDTFRFAGQQPHSMAWIGLYRPADAQLIAARRPRVCAVLRRNRCGIW